MIVRFSLARSDIEEMLRREGETEQEWAERLNRTRREKANGVAISLTPETKEEEGDIEAATRINSFFQHLLTPHFQIDTQGRKEFHLSFS